MREFRAFAAIALAGSLAACNDPSLTTAKSFDTICASEPPIYAAFLIAASARGVSQKTLNTAEAAHVLVTETCAAPPADIAQGLVVVAKAYATVLAARAQTAQKGI